ncbi:hypothetical protein CH375_06725 [Leptospira ellisii]|uniref:Uncharacterized protein n=1 Tax=Leptospira ellisii TaxID=2023197 RepID=A0A2N0BCI6_9LEPT|nr:hypothetical protein CH379_03425 [Leptospira ellisii]PKA05167.1 hypothetical protein CH375_06725 [Leptospira ellisii]
MVKLCFFYEEKIRIPIPLFLRHPSRKEKKKVIFAEFSLSPWIRLEIGSEFHWKFISAPGNSSDAKRFFTVCFVFFSRENFPNSVF